MLEVAQTVMGVLVEGMQALVAVEILGPSQGMRTWTENILRYISWHCFPFPLHSLRFNKNIWFVLYLLFISHLV